MKITTLKASSAFVCVIGIVTCICSIYEHNALVAIWTSIAVTQAVANIFELR